MKNMKYGSTIGSKFFEDGSVRRFPGNTVVAPILPNSGAYQPLVYLRKAVDETFGDYFVMLPEDSYHITVISGLNDERRSDTRWPPALSKEATLEEMDEYVAQAVSRVDMIGALRMRFDHIEYSRGCMIVLCRSADEQQEKLLREYRDAVAAEIGFKLPGHDTFRFHASLAYTRVIPEGEDAERLKALIAEMDEYLARQHEFETDPPYLAFYDDMLSFPTVRKQ